MKRFLALMVLAMCATMVGCAVTVPTGSYIPQNYVRYDAPSDIDIGKFTYRPLTEGRVKKGNQIRNTAAGSIHISSDVAEFVRRATALEFEKSGIKIKDNANISVVGDILDFTIDDLGYSVTVSYSIEYGLIDKRSSAAVFSKTYSPTPKKGGKFGTAESIVETLNEQVVAAYDMFARDPGARRYLDAGK